MVLVCKRSNNNSKLDSNSRCCGHAACRTGGCTHFASRYFAATSLACSLELLMRSLMSTSVSRLVRMASVGISRSTSVAIESRRLSRSSTSRRPLWSGTACWRGGPSGLVAAPEARARPDDRAGAPARSAGARAHRRDRLATSPPAGAAGTARSIARAWCRASWRDHRCNCAEAANFPRVARSTGVSDRAT